MGLRGGLGGEFNGVERDRHEHGWYHGEGSSDRRGSSLLPLIQWYKRNHTRVTLAALLAMKKTRLNHSLEVIGALAEEVVGSNNWIPYIIQYDFQSSFHKVVIEN